MRRIPRLRRPSGLNSPAIFNHHAVSQPASGPSRISQCLAPFSSTSTHRQRPTARATATTRQSCLSTTPARFYSSEKEPTIIPVQAREQTETEARTQTQEPGDETALVPEGLPNDLAAEPTGKKRKQRSPYHPPQQRLDAAREADVADPTYVPATVAKGLQTVGGVADWWTKQTNWGRAGDFVAFHVPKKITDPVVVEATVRRAVIEAFALRAVGQEDALVAPWSADLSKERVAALLACQVRSSGGALVFNEGEAEAVVEGLQGERERGSRDPLKVKEIMALREKWDASWKSASLADPRIRFAVTKRLFQLTNRLVPDHQLAAITTVQSLLYTLQKPPKPATLTKELQRHDALKDLPNVTIAKRRVTRGDKEIALGRYGLMQAEFAKRGLPARGYGRADKGKEISRLRGGV
ncbi:ribosomal subunit 39S-domain-containing protein [Xylaria intraflava]|nr:ribosomal subunit 39S-domain-containing protein [Xylaria intraflava]